jgi:hypothetical protein
MKKINEKELKIYEALGIKQFRKIGFIRRNFITCALVYPFTLPMKRKERYKCVDKLYYEQKSNFNLGKITNLDDIKKYKRYPVANAIRYTIDLLTCVPIIIKIIDGRSPLLSTISTTSAIIINLYCIMLQRYNAIRLNRVVEKVELHNETFKKEEIIESKQEEKKTTFKEVINNSTIEQLKRYRNYLVEYQKESHNKEDIQVKEPQLIKQRVRK